MTENETGTVIIECAIEVHRESGPGLLETVYEVALSYLLKEKGLPNERQVPIPLETHWFKIRLPAELRRRSIKRWNRKSGQWA